MDLQAPTAPALAVTLTLVIACGSKRLPEWKTSPTPRQNAKRVDHLEAISNLLAWRRSPYFRVDDAVNFPVYLIVAHDRTACITPEEDWSVADPGDLYPCPRQWRIPRP